MLLHPVSADYKAGLRRMAEYAIKPSLRGHFDRPRNLRSSASNGGLHEKRGFFSTLLFAMAALRSGVQCYSANPVSWLSPVAEVGLPLRTLQSLAGGGLGEPGENVTHPIRC